MAFNARELSVLAYANGFTLWHYRTADPSASLTEEAGIPPSPIVSGYFAAAGELLRPGDQIIVNLLGENRPRIMSLVVTDVEPNGPVGVATV
jgi:hypothetical protein